LPVALALIDQTEHTGRCELKVAKQLLAAFVEATCGHGRIEARAVSVSETASMATGFLGAGSCWPWTWHGEGV
jgi:hypothetical protein